MKKVFLPFITSEKNSNFKLKSAARNSKLNVYLQDQNFIGIHKTENIYELIEKNDFHFLVTSMRNGTNIFGELWEVDDMVADKLNEYYRNYSDVNEDNVFINSFEDEDIHSYFLEEN